MEKQKNKIRSFFRGKEEGNNHQIKGLQITLVIVLLCLLAPIAWHHLGIDSGVDKEVKVDLDSLTLVYIKQLEEKKLKTKKIDEFLVSDFKKQNRFPDQKAYKGENIKPESEEIIKEFQNIKIQKEIKLLNLNKANAEELKTIYGIGEVLSKRIIKFREKLGGLYSISQLKEVYGIDSTKLPTIRRFIDQKTPLLVSKLKVNQLEFKQLLKHPYLNYEDVKKIFNNRPITERNICRIISNCERLKPYLDYSEI